MTLSTDLAKLINQGDHTSALRHIEECAPLIETADHPSVARAPTRNASSADRAYRRVTRIVEELLSAGDLNFTLDDLRMWLPDIRVPILQATLRRLMAQGQVMRPSSHCSHWFAVPLELQFSSELPFEIWIDYYFKKMAGFPYYVGLLSAASLHGAEVAPLSALQVMLPRVAAPFTLAGTTIHPSLRRHGSLPTERHEARWGSFCISTPELTILDLARPSFRYRAVAHFGRTLRSLARKCKPPLLRELIISSEDYEAAGRLATFLHGTDSCFESLLRQMA